MRVASGPNCSGSQRTKDEVEFGDVARRLPRRRPPASSGRTACGRHGSRRTAPYRLDGDTCHLVLHRPDLALELRDLVCTQCLLRRATCQFRLSFMRSPPFSARRCESSIVTAITHVAGRRAESGQRSGTHSGESGDAIRGVGGHLRECSGMTLEPTCCACSSGLGGRTLPRKRFSEAPNCVKLWRASFNETTFAPPAYSRHRTAAGRPPKNRPGKCRTCRAVHSQG